MARRIDSKAVGNNWNVSGQENADGSDESGNEVGDMEVVCGNYEKWDMVKNNKRKKKRRNKSDESDSDRCSALEETVTVEYKVFAKPVQEGDTFGESIQLVPYSIPVGGGNAPISLVANRQ